MLNWIFYGLMLICGYTVYRVVLKIRRQRKHLDDETLRKVMRNNIRDEPDYDDVIAHLGICRKCEKRLYELTDKE